ncbi:hydrogenase maturation nickel metallochaperone HypA [Planctomycetota bacterium]
MHEYSIASGIRGTVLENAKKHKASKILTINLEIGEITFLNTEQVVFWLKELLKQTVAQNARIHVKHIRPIIKCLDCDYQGGLKFEEDERCHWSLPTFLCPKCNSYNIKIVHGRECMVKNIQVEN